MKICYMKDDRTGERFEIPNDESIDFVERYENPERLIDMTGLEFFIGYMVKHFKSISLIGISIFIYINSAMKLGTTYTLDHKVIVLMVIGFWIVFKLECVESTLDILRRR